MRYSGANKHEYINGSPFTVNYTFRTIDSEAFNGIATAIFIYNDVTNDSFHLESNWLNELRIVTNTCRVLFFHKRRNVISLNFF